jgi:hypothetical protein
VPAQSQSPTPPYQENIVEASRSSVALSCVCATLRLHCDDYTTTNSSSFSLFFTSLLLERPFFPPCVPLLHLVATVWASFSRPSLVCRSFRFHRPEVST